MIIDYRDSREDITAEFLDNIHPGNILRLDYLPRMGVTEYRFAKLLGITQSHLAELLSGRRGITPNLSLRLGKLFGQAPGYWLNVQSQHDLLKAFRDYGEAIDAVQPFEWPEGQPFPGDKAV